MNFSYQFYIYIYIKRKCANSNVVQYFGLFNLYALFIKLFFFFFSLHQCWLCFLSFPLNMYYLYVHIHLHRLSKFLQYFHNYLTIGTVHWPLFSFFLFFSPQYTGFACALFVFSFKYLYVHIQLHWHNTFLQYFHNYWGVNFLKVKIK